MRFRIGAGSVLFISALGMAQGKSAVQTDNVQQDVTIVPLTIPLTVGPGTIGALLVMGVSQPHWDDKITAILSIALASFTVGVVLYLSNRIERILGDQGLQIVSRLMGLFVCALAAQIIFTGVRGYLVPSDPVFGDCQLHLVARTLTHQLDGFFVDHRGIQHQAGLPAEGLERGTVPLKKRQPHVLADAMGAVGHQHHHDFAVGFGAGRQAKIAPPDARCYCA